MITAEISREGILKLQSLGETDDYALSVWIERTFDPNFRNKFISKDCIDVRYSSGETEGLLE